jgi:subtilisin family serine protease
MAKKKASSGIRNRNQKATAPAVERIGADTSEFTGRYLVIFQENGVAEGLKQIKNACGVSNVCQSSDFANGAMDMEQASNAEIVLFDEIQVAVVDGDADQLSKLESSGSSAIVAVEPEQYMYALNSLEYWKGYRDAVNQVYETMLIGGAGTQLLQPGAASSALSFADTNQFTWGIQATKVDRSMFTGRGVRVAVLDTGFDMDGHPDFVGRTIVSRSFIPNEQVQDQNGHGTHCIGTAIGPKTPASGVRRYGCASDGEIFVGKVLSNAGSGADQGILAGINWAIANRCRIISMSLGGRVTPGQSFSTIYETIASRALASSPGTIIIAAAGNDSRNPITGSRLNPPMPVGRPANCPSIMAVGSLDSALRVSSFSNGGINSGGGEVNIAGPGSAVFSSVPDPFPASMQPTGPGRPWPARHHTISGTSMATPHVAGIAALWLESNPNLSASQLWQTLIRSAMRLPLPPQDVGAGFVQAP